LTDVTGFGLGGHLREMCEGSGLQAVIQFDQVPVLPHIPQYLEMDCSPGGAKRNFDSYGYALGDMSERQRQIICDPQTSGGLLVAIAPEGEAEFLAVCRQAGMDLQTIGYLREPIAGSPLITVE
jgi:selenide,water dikinase